MKTSWPRVGWEGAFWAGGLSISHEWFGVASPLWLDALIFGVMATVLWLAGKAWAFVGRRVRVTVRVTAPTPARDAP